MVTPSVTRSRKPARARSHSRARVRPLVDLPDNIEHLAAECRARIEPVAERMATTTVADVTIIDLYDVIGSVNANARDFRDALNHIATPQITIRINSPGGLVFDGIAMYNDLARHPAKVRVEIVGLAASAASIIAMAGDTISIADSAHMMLHNAWVVSIGDRHEKREVAGILDGVDASLARVYAARTGMPVGKIAAMLDAETWLDAPKAVKLGFADRVDQVKAESFPAYNYGQYRNAPAAIAAATPRQKPLNDRVPTTIRELEHLLRDRGFNKHEATRLVSGGWKAFSRKPDKLPGSRQLAAHIRALTFQLEHRLSCVAA